MNTSCQRLAAIGVLMGAVFGPASAYADAWDDFLTHTYIGIGGGVNLAGEADTSGPGFAGEAEYELGWAAAGTFGYRTDFGLRTELEVSRRVNDVDTFAGIGTGGGDTTSWAFMANLLYDIPTGTRLRPYLGGGAGIALTSVGSLVTPIPGLLDDDDTGFAYQGIAGVSYALFNALELFADYRYFAVEELGFTTAGGGTIALDNHNHTFMLGLRLALAVPPPPMPPAPVVVAPPPAPAPVVAAPPPPPPPPEIDRAFIVFFDFDSNALTDIARDTIRLAAENARVGAVTQIEIAGHADRAGNDAYNLDLSRRRAEAVSQALEAEGLSRNQIGVSWFGERDPFIDTNDGVREPRNRRVEIVFP